MTPKYIMTRTPDEAVTAIVTAQSKSLELRIPRNVNEEAFKARTRNILKKRGLYVELLNAKRNHYKGILVMK